MVVVSSVYAFANGMGNTPYAVAKAGVEALGRSLRVELAPHGASATVAYFGWVDTKLVQDAFDQEDSDRIRDLSPDFLLKRITPDEAAAGLVRGIEERAPRVFVPKWWRYVSALRGVINPLLDRRMEGDEKMAALLRDLDAKTVDAAETSSAS
jgi:NAD(P)-dependent dehydrogenase (short-subunit alcohol dehydrogenase family)